MIVEKIPLDQIHIQNNYHNRKPEEFIVETQSFMELLTSIEKTKGVFQPIVLCKKDDNKYELVAGYRRYLVYKRLVLISEDKELFKSIPSVISDFCEDVITKSTITEHENLYRENPSAEENLKRRVSLVPFFLGCGVEGKKEQNFNMGIRLLKLFVSMDRSISEANKNKLEKEIIKLCGCENVIDSFMSFFEHIKHRPRVFFEKTKIFEYEPSILQLYMEGRLHEKTPHLLQKVFALSKEDGKEIIAAIKEEELTKDYSLKRTQEYLEKLSKDQATTEDELKSVAALVAKKYKKLSKRNQDSVKSYLNKLKKIIGENNEEN
ncbi:MAG: ParB N-terminal domain-containing protein [Epsilonproteobacteria bacterium]|nr:ParB N-terminal domain-containing protein [Campylobacterota bacterium]